MPPHVTPHRPLASLYAPAALASAGVASFAALTLSAHGHAATGWTTLILLDGVGGLAIALRVGRRPLWWATWSAGLSLVGAAVAASYYAALIPRDDGDDLWPIAIVLITGVTFVTAFCSAMVVSFARSRAR